MGRDYCEYCDAWLSHDSQSVRKQHNTGFKHLANVRAYYACFLENFVPGDLPPGATLEAPGAPRAVLPVPQMECGPTVTPGGPAPVQGAPVSRDPAEMAAVLQAQAQAAMKAIQAAKKSAGGAKAPA